MSEHDIVETLQRRANDDYGFGNIPNEATRGKK